MSEVTKLTLEYDGTPFAGWARQPGKRTIAGELEQALLTSLRTPVSLTVAGRTDAGVHALGQVVSYLGDPPKLRSVNALLPNEISVTAIESKPAEFSARHDAQSRTYVYRIHTRRFSPSPFELRRALWWPHRLDFEQLELCAKTLLGRHDFRAFTPTETFPRYFTRIIARAEWKRLDDGETLEFWIESSSFIRHMNRILVATMLEVAGKRRSLENFVELLTGRPRSEAAATAPPHGLYLASVRY